MERLRLPHTSPLTRTVIKAMSIFGSLQMLTILCGVVRVKCVALWIGATGLGYFTIFNSALTLISTFTQLNLRTSSVREIASSDSTGRRHVTGMVVRRLSWILGLIGGLVMVVTAPMFSLNTFSDYSYSLPFALLAVGVLFMSTSMGEQALMQGYGHMRALAHSSLWANVGGLALCLPLVWFFGEAGVLPSILAYCVAGYLFCLPFRVRLEPTSPLRHEETWRVGKPMLRLGVYMTVAAAFSELMAYILIAWINTRGDTAEVGIFQAGYTIVNRYVMMIFTAVGMEFFPRLASASHSPHRQGVFVSHEVKLLLMSLVPMLMVFVPLVKPVVRLLYSAEFDASVPYILLALPGMVLRVLQWCQSYLITARGDGRVFIFTEGASDLLMLLLCLPAFVKWGIPGLGAAFTLATMGSTLLIAAVYRYRYGLRVAPGVMMLLLASLLLVSAAVGVMMIM
ncbi:MAG: oligosaccharide flippase family protein [Muribaculaceae bacterium]|nr:oligosaccharide flippase family protein [Muribaculaceae bacterium]